MGCTSFLDQLIESMSLCTSTQHPSQAWFFFPPSASWIEGRTGGRRVNHEAVGA